MQPKYGEINLEVKELDLKEDYDLLLKMKNLSIFNIY
jgi:hypothetical protein